MVLSNVEVLNPLLVVCKMGFNPVPQRVKFCGIKGSIYTAPFNCVLT